MSNVGRRTGGLEIQQLQQLEQLEVGRRTGGLEINAVQPFIYTLVGRRTGGLETFPRSSSRSRGRRRIRKK